MCILTERINRLINVLVILITSNIQASNIFGCSDNLELTLKQTRVTNEKNLTKDQQDILHENVQNIDIRYSVLIEGFKQKLEYIYKISSQYRKIQKKDGLIEKLLKPVNGFAENTEMKVL